jgi:hypothetical protein
MSDRPLSNEEALQYISELIGEYMKTLPPPVRGPVVQSANACLGKLSEAIKPKSDVELKPKPEKK